MSVGDLYAVLAGFFWAFCVILMRVSVLRIPPVSLTLFKSALGVVFFVATLVVLQVCGSSDAAPNWGECFFRPLAAADYWSLVISAILGITIADTLFVAALNRLGASLQALADCIYSPAMAGVGFLMFGEHLGPWEIMGGALVVAGVGVGMHKAKDVQKRDLVIGALFAAGAHVIMAVGILMVRDSVLREGGVSVIWVSGFRFLVATIALALLARIWMPTKTLLLGFTMRETWKFTVPMSFLGPYLASIFWVAGFKHASAGRAAIFNQLSTPFIVILAVLLLKERMTEKKVVGIILAAIGAILVASQNQSG